MKKQAIILFLFALVCGVAVFGQSPDFTVKKIGEGVYAAVANDGGKAGSNSGFIVGSNGVAVVDSFEEAGPAKTLLAEIHKITNQPVRYVINTHYHLDHTGGNGAYAEAGATILAHRNLRAWERTENLKFFGKDPKPEYRTMVESLVLPDMVYSEAVDLYLGSRLVQVRYMLGHTGGDSVVIVPDANVVFGGDLVWQKHLPNLIDASTGAWIKTLDKLLTDHPKATFVSGHGDVASVDDVRSFRNYIQTLRDDVAKAQSSGKSGQELTDTVEAELKPKYEEWGFYKNFVKRNIEQTAAELIGQKRLPPMPAEGQ
ncbi:MAG TPA: MBL fold metallo-hydrolase [Candidatus Angelobacter sp.]|jgi:glyoxylase-like metal-dependent hydrolase (beta-lactamase superfamily II)|nr:MBL fold metallo-hydrolase [Candidatus Angelobacter sp.]